MFFCFVLFLLYSLEYYYSELCHPGGHAVVTKVASYRFSQNSVAPANLVQKLDKNNMILMLFSRPNMLGRFLHQGDSAVV